MPSRPPGAANAETDAGDASREANDSVCSDTITLLQTWPGGLAPAGGVHAARGAAGALPSLMQTAVMETVSVLRMSQRLQQENERGHEQIARMRNATAALQADNAVLRRENEELERSLSSGALTSHSHDSLHDFVGKKSQAVREFLHSPQPINVAVKAAIVVAVIIALLYARYRWVVYQRRRARELAKEEERVRKEEEAQTQRGRRGMANAFEKQKASEEKENRGCCGMPQLSEKTIYVSLAAGAAFTLTGAALWHFEVIQPFLKQLALYAYFGIAIGGILALATVWVWHKLKAMKNKLKGMIKEVDALNVTGFGMAQSQAA